MTKKVKLSDAVKALNEAGYMVRRKTVYVKHTFQVDDELLKAFFVVQSGLGLQVKDAINEALLLWIRWRQANPDTPLEPFNPKEDVSASKDD